VKRWVPFGLVVLACASCDRLARRSAPDAGIETATTSTITPIIVPHDGGLSPSALASALHQASEEEDEEPAADGGVQCPIPIFPGYCRRRCRSFLVRESSMHARRISHPLRAGTGTCGTYKVFAEEERGEDGGAAGGLVEYYDETNALVGAEDSRRKPCGTFGKIPKGCKLEIKWGPPRGGGLGDLRK
jgi:hypothetical protein